MLPCQGKTFALHICDDSCSGCLRSCVQPCLAPEFAEDPEVAQQWAKFKVECSQKIEEGHVGCTIVHQWRWDSASLWHLGCRS